MTEQEKRKGGGGKLSRTETVTVRLDPRLRYLADLAARKQRRSLSSYIEWVIEESLKKTYLASEHEQAESLAEQAPALWDVDDADRFVKLALRHPQLLTHEEQVRWKLISENGYLWRGRYDCGEWTWRLTEDSLSRDRLREHWEAFCQVAETGVGRDRLPTWPKSKVSPPDFDDSITF